MQARVSWPAIGRCALVTAALASMTLLGGCSSGVSRFDFPSFNLARSSEPQPLADPNTTASLPPVPQESIYAQGAQGNYQSNYQGGSYTRSTLPPPSGYQNGAYAQSSVPQAPRAYNQTTPVAYAPPQALKPQKVNYAPPGPARPNYDKVRAAGRAPGEDTYTVQVGDTPTSIAQKTGVNVKALIARNDLKPPRLKVGQVLYLPKGGKAPAPAAVASAAKKPASPAPDVKVVKTTTITPPGAAAKAQASAKPQAAPEPAASDDDVTGGQNRQVASTKELPAPEPMSGNSFRWPVQGRIISEFGTKPDGGHNDGINVAVPIGTSVKAAENGVVAYAGDELKGYGNLVLIRHSNNWVSAYAHNEEILVKRGDQVRRGQVIAKAGRSGQVNQPQLHFELRKGSRPVDPTKYMTHSTANAD
jgi:murein DD-endopeptidase MepM/ murein hydrolase activator NlpD